MRMRNFGRQFTIIAALAVWAIPSFAQTQTGGGRIIGRVTAEAPGELPETVVYLSPVDPNAKFSPPTETLKISQAGAKFSPGMIVVCVGQTVEFLNDEPRPIQHNVFSKSPAKPFDLGLYKPGDSKRVTFDKPGPVHLHCSIHRNMDGVIFVSPTPYFAVVGADGRFALENVAPGEYELKTWQRKQRYLDRTQRVTAPASGEVTVEVGLSRK